MQLLSSTDILLAFLCRGVHLAISFICEFKTVLPNNAKVETEVRVLGIYQWSREANKRGLSNQRN